MNGTTHGQQTLSQDSVDMFDAFPSGGVSLFKPRRRFEHPFTNRIEQVGEMCVIAPPFIDSQVLSVSFCLAKSCGVTTYLLLLQERSQELHVRRIRLDVDHALVTDI